MTPRVTQRFGVFSRFYLENDLLAVLLEAINTQLSEKSLTLKLGSVSIIDASVIEAKQHRPSKGKKGQRTQDPDTGWNVKTGSDGKQKSTYGFKAPINVDEDGFIQKVDFS
ncbi:MAG: hypothetical protein ACWIPH_00275 [Ostreibacterium sp.]